MTDLNRDGHASHSLHGGVYPGNLFMVVAPSGAGKSTLVNALLSKDSDICLSISYTTRKPRPGEQDGQHYHFTTVEDFRARHAAHEFLESAEVHGNYYGTSRVWIEEQMKNGHDVLLEIDWQGALRSRRSRCGWCAGPAPRDRTPRAARGRSGAEFPGCGPSACRARLHGRCACGSRAAASRIRRSASLARARAGIRARARRRSRCRAPWCRRIRPARSLRRVSCSGA